MPEPEKQERGLVGYTSRDGQEIKLSFDTVRKYLVSGKAELVTDQEIVLYMGTCKARGLNPFKKDCYLVKYTEHDPAATIVAIDYYRARAKAQPDCVGWKSGIILQTDKGIEYREGAFILEGEKLVGGWFRGKPKHWEAEYTWTVPLNSYIKKRADGQITQFWREENQAYMIHKVVESQGLHRLWPDEFQGLQLDEEFQALRDVTPTPEPIKTPQPLAMQPPQALHMQPKGKDDGPKSISETTEDRHAGNVSATSDQRSANTGTGGNVTEKAAGRKKGAELASVPTEKPQAAAEKSQEDIIAECLLWVENCTVEELHAKNPWVMGQLWLVKGTENQLKILRPFNTRRQLTG
jgi:phage recombination protein Bet